MSDKAQEEPGFKIQGEHVEAKQDKLIKQLEERLLEEKNARLEERFIWILILVILVNAYIFSQMPSWGGPIAILILESLLLVIIARMLGVDEVARILDRLINQLPGKK